MNSRAVDPKLVFDELYAFVVSIRLLPTANPSDGFGGSIASQMAGEAAHHAARVRELLGPWPPLDIISTCGRTTVTNYLREAWWRIPWQNGWELGRPPSPDEAADLAELTGLLQRAIHGTEVVEAHHSAQSQESEPQHGEFDEQTLPPRYRDDHRADGEPLTVPYLCESRAWSLTPRLLAAARSKGLKWVWVTVSGEPQQAHDFQPLVNWRMRKSGHQTHSPIPPNAPVLKVALARTGRIRLNGVETSIDALRESLRKLADQEGVVWYYREAANREPPPQAMEVLKMVTEMSLPIRISSRPDYSDAVGLDGKPLSGLKQLDEGDEHRSDGRLLHFLNSIRAWFR